MSNLGDVRGRQSTVAFAVAIGMLLVSFLTGSDDLGRFSLLIGSCTFSVLSVVIGRESMRLWDDMIERRMLYLNALAIRSSGGDDGALGQLRAEIQGRDW